MCLSPITIPNPNFGHHNSVIYRRTAWKVDCDSRYINVPCGVCSQCIAVKQMDVVQRCQMESKNSFLFFTTLTYDNEHLPHLLTSTGYDIPYASIRDLQLMFKRLRMKDAFGRPFRYFAVSERGSERGRPHFHILWFLPMYPGEDYVDGVSLTKRIYNAVKDDWVTCSSRGKNSVNIPLFTFHQRWIGGKLKTNYDTHFVVPTLGNCTISSVAFYVCKYMLKTNPRERRLQQAFRLNMSDSEYLSSWNLVKSQNVRSSSFGLGASHNHDLIISYLRDCVSRSDRSRGFPCFFTIDSGQSFPLCKYYRNNVDIFTEKDWLEFNMDKDVHIFREDNGVQDIMKYNKVFDQISHVDSKDFTIDLPFILDYD